MKKEKEPRYKKHIVKCPSCQKDILDHMSICPYCNTPISGVYKELDPMIKKRIKISLTVILGLTALILIILKATQVI